MLKFLLNFNYRVTHSPLKFVTVNGFIMMTIAYFCIDDFNLVATFPCLSRFLVRQLSSVQKINVLQVLKHNSKK